LLTDTTATIGDSVCILTTVTPLNDYDPSNNIIQECYPVFASFDPNEKTVSPSVADTSVHQFTFTVYFQNTGTAPAANIYILDSLDADLDASTFEVLGSSHEVVTQLLPGNILRFNYHAIELPDSTNDEPNSHGFVKYRVNRNVNTGVGTEITNTAYIYFDYNEAVVTNTVSVEITSPVGISIVNTGFENIIIYPNPASSVLYIRSAAGNISSINICDIYGKDVFSKKNPGASLIQVPVSSLSKGVYFVNVKDDKGASTTKKFIVQ